MILPSPGATSPDFQTPQLTIQISVAILSIAERKRHLTDLHPHLVSLRHCHHTYSSHLLAHVRQVVLSPVFTVESRLFLE